MSIAGRVAGITLLLSQTITPFAGSPDPILGCSDSFAILSASGVSNTGRSYIFGNLGVSPSATVTGFPPGVVREGSLYVGGPVVHEARRDAFSAYNRLARLPSFPIPSVVEGDLGGLTLYPGVYALNTSAHLKGTLVLDARGADHAVFIFQIGSMLTTAPGAAVILVNPGREHAVYWQVGNSARLGRNTSFEGNILANRDIAIGQGSRIRCGRAFTMTGAVVTDRNYIFSTCDSLEGGFRGAGAGWIEAGRNQGRATALPEPGTFWLAAASVALLIAVKFHRARHSR